MIIAQITDLHVRPHGSPAYGRVDTNLFLSTCVEHIEHLETKPDLVIATGDLTDCGRDSEYSILRDLLSKLSMPFLLVPGNHDLRERMRAHFPDHNYLGSHGYMNFVIDTFPVTIIGLDSVVEGKSHGQMTQEHAQFLDMTLKAHQQKPAMICLHHPPFQTGLQGMDAIGCFGGDIIEEVISKHPQVERVICGHHHRLIQTMFAGTIGVVAPSPAHQVTLDLSQQGNSETYIMEPPGYLLHLKRDDKPMVTHFMPIGQFDGPYPFDLDPDYPGSVSSLSE